MEIQGEITFTPEERLREIAAEIHIKCEDEWRDRIFRFLSKDEINAILADKELCKLHEPSFAKVAERELWMRKTLARAQEVGEPYCVYHDCKITDCPDRHLFEE